MYTVKCDGEWLYNPTLNYQLTKPKLTRADNSAGSFEFTMHKDHPMYDRIEEITSRVYVYRDGVEIWEGRPFKETDDWYGSRTVYCEGALAYLNDTIQEQAEYHDNSVKTWLTTLINKHNAKVDASRQFKIGNITVEDNLYRYTNFETTLDAINDKLISRLGGHLRVRKSNGVNYLDYLKDYPYSSTQKIEFGRNLLDYSRNFDLADIATVIIPLGARLEESPIEALEAYTTVESVNGGSLYVQNDTAVKNFGWICKAVHWDDVTIPSNLLTKAEKYLTDFQYDEMSLEVKAVDFHMVDSKIEALELLDRVEVVSAPHGLDKLFPISKMEMVLNDPASTTLTLGDLDTSTSSLTSKNNESNKQLLQKIEEIPTESAILKEAKEQATELITSGALGSYVIILPDEIIVTNNLNYTAKTAHVWRWNKNGLGYSSTGYNGTFGTAMTADGAIVADRITTGTMYADRIKGGTLTLGGVSNGNGKMVWCDAQGNRIGYIDNTGIYVERGKISSDLMEVTLLTTPTSEKYPDGALALQMNYWGNYSTSSSLRLYNKKLGSSKSIMLKPGTDSDSSIIEAFSTLMMSGYGYEDQQFAMWLGSNGDIVSPSGSYKLKYILLGAGPKGNPGSTGGSYIQIIQALPSKSIKGHITIRGQSGVNLGSQNRSGALTVDDNGTLINGPLKVVLGSVYHTTTSQYYTLQSNRDGQVYGYYDNSTKRDKTDIQNVSEEILDPKRLYNIPIRQFKYKDRVLTDGDRRKGVPIIGFIAEEVEKEYPLAADYDEDGRVLKWNAHYIIPPMLGLIQEQKKKLDELENRIIKLEQERGLTNG